MIPVIRGTGSGDIRHLVCRWRSQVEPQGGLRAKVCRDSVQGRQGLCLGQHSPTTHTTTRLAWWNAEARGWGQAAKVSLVVEKVKSCLSPFLQTISDISLDNTTLSRCRPQPPLPAPPRPLQLFILA